MQLMAVTWPHAQPTLLGPGTPVKLGTTRVVLQHLPAVLPQPCHGQPWSLAGILTHRQTSRLGLGPASSPWACLEILATSDAGYPHETRP